LIALGSNQRHVRFGPPRAVLRAALIALQAAGLELEAISLIIDSAPLGPSQRRYANAAAVATSAQGPRALLALLQQIERRFGRKRRGQRWRARTLDLDVVLWQGGVWRDKALTIPHPEFRHRLFVLGPSAAIAPEWRDPMTHCTLRHLRARLTRRNAAPR
jgi:2-amino-4-hydroxy-6-hydroxymethyldihydropteridine diphosphokinase